MSFTKKASIIKRVKNKIQKIKICIRYILRYNIVQSKSVFFLSSSELKEKNLMHLIYYFHSLGYNCYLDYSFRQCLKLKVNGISALSLQNVFPAEKKENTFEIVASRNKQKLDSFGSNALKIHINYLEIENGFADIADITEVDFYYPIGLHPNLANLSIEAEVLKNAFNTDRKIGVFFAGAIYDKKDGITKKYNYDSLKKQFNVNSRYEVFTSIFEKLPKEYIYTPDSLETFLNDMESGHLKNKIVLIERNIFSIPPDKYFNVLLNSNFFIHMAGVAYPFCHNQIESMLAGCVPITQFSRFFSPAFTHELNALLFNSLDELFSLLNDIVLGKYTGHLDSMREEIVNYYKNYYSVVSFNSKLLYLSESNIKHTNFCVCPL